jgi:hypothetical protein
MGLDMYFKQVPKHAVSEDGKSFDYILSNEIAYWRKSYTLHTLILEYGLENGLITQDDLRYDVYFQLYKKDLDEIIIRYIKETANDKDLGQVYTRQNDLRNLVNGYDAFTESETLWFMDSM